MPDRHLDQTQRVPPGLPGVYPTELICEVDPQQMPGNDTPGENQQDALENNMIIRQGLKAIGWGLLAAATAAPQAFAADAYNGERLARRWCEPCHVVASDQRQVTGEAPPFATIARRPGFDQARLAFFLLDPHPKMPDMSLTRFEAGDLAAYIATLAKK
jgi:mono/diheme cytochrome c family protein